MALSLPVSLSLQPMERLFGQIDEVADHAHFLNLERPVKSVCLPFDAQEQQHSLWCWAAVATSVGLFYGSGNWTQCAIVTDQVNNLLSLGEQHNCCSTPGSGLCDVEGLLLFSLQQVESLRYCNTVQPTAEDIFKLLSQRRELLCLTINWLVNGKPSKLNHFTTICGMTDPADSEEVMVTVSDTLAGPETCTLPYARFPSSYRDGGVWHATFYTRGYFGQGVESGSAVKAAVAVDNHCNCIALRVDQGKLFSCVGKMDALNQVVSWRASRPVDTCTTAAISLDNNANCLTVYANDNELFHRVGQLDVTRGEVVWQNPVKYGRGESNAIALGDYGLAIEAHVEENQMHYSVGYIENGELNWRKPTAYGRGAANTIALNQDRYCIEVHRGTDDNAGTLYYQVGMIDFFKITQGISKINFGPAIAFDAGKAPALTLAANGECLVVFSGTNAESGNLYFRRGKLNTANQTIEWFPRVLYDEGESAVVGMDDTGKCVELHISGQQVLTRVGR